MINPMTPSRAATLVSSLDALVELLTCVDGSALQKIREEFKAASDVLSDKLAEADQKLAVVNGLKNAAETLHKEAEARMTELIVQANVIEGDRQRIASAKAAADERAKMLADAEAKFTADVAQRAGQLDARQEQINKSVADHMVRVGQHQGLLDQREDEIAAREKAVAIRENAVAAREQRSAQAQAEAIKLAETVQDMVRKVQI